MSIDRVGTTCTEISQATSQKALEWIRTDGKSNTVAPKAAGFYTFFPLPLPANTDARTIRKAMLGNLAQFRFAVCAPAAALPATISYGIWGLQQLTPGDGGLSISGFSVAPMIFGTATIGVGTVADVFGIAAGNEALYFCDVITITTDYTRLAAARVRSNPAGGWATLECDQGPIDQIMFELSCSTGKPLLAYSAY